MLCDRLFVFVTHLSMVLVLVRVFIAMIPHHDQKQLGRDSLTSWRNGLTGGVS